MESEGTSSTAQQLVEAFCDKVTSDVMTCAVTETKKILAIGSSVNNVQKNGSDDSAASRSEPVSQQSAVLPASADPPTSACQASSTNAPLTVAANALKLNETAACDVPPEPQPAVADEAEKQSSSEFVDSATAVQDSVTSHASAAVQVDVTTNASGASVVQDDVTTHTKSAAVVQDDVTIDASSVIDAVMLGRCRMDQLSPLPKKVVRIFVSSTFTGQSQPSDVESPSVRGEDRKIAPSCAHDSQ